MAARDGAGGGAKAKAAPASAQMRPALPPLFKEGALAYTAEDWKQCCTSMDKYLKIQLKKRDVDLNVVGLAYGMLYHSAKQLNQDYSSSPTLPFTDTLNDNLAACFEAKLPLYDLSTVGHLKKFFITKILLNWKTQVKWLHTCFVLNREESKLVKLLSLCMAFGLEDHITLKDLVLFKDLMNAIERIAGKEDMEFADETLFALSVAFRIDSLSFSKSSYKCLFMAQGFCLWSEDCQNTFKSGLFLPELKKLCSVKDGGLQNFYRILLRRLKSLDSAKTSRSLVKTFLMVANKYCNAVQKRTCYESLYDVVVDASEYALARDTMLFAQRHLPKWNKATLFGLRLPQRCVTSFVTKLNNILNNVQPNDNEAMELLGYLLQHSTNKEMEESDQKIILKERYGRVALSSFSKSRQWDALFRLFFACGPNHFEMHLTAGKSKDLVSISSVLLSDGWRADYMDVLLRSGCPKGTQRCLDYCMEKKELNLAVKLLQTEHLNFSNEVKAITRGDPVIHRIVKFALKCDNGILIKIAKENWPGIDFLQINAATGETILHILAKVNVSASFAEDCFSILQSTGVDCEVKNRRGESANDLVMHPETHPLAVLFSVAQYSPPDSGDGPFDATEKSAQQTTDDVALLSSQCCLKSDVKASDTREHATNDTVHKMHTAPINSKHLLQEMRETIQGLDVAHALAEKRFSTEPRSKDLIGRGSNSEIAADKLLPLLPPESFLFENHPWEIVLTGQSLQFLMENSLNTDDKMEMLERLDSLSRGERPFDTVDQLLIEGDVCVPVYRTVLTNGLSIVWEQRPLFSERCSKAESEHSGSVTMSGCHVYVDGILIWDFLNEPSEFDSIVSQVKHAHMRGMSSTSKRYLKRSSHFEATEDIHKDHAPLQYEVLPADGLRPEQLPCDVIVLYPLANPEEVDNNIMRTFTLQHAMVKNPDVVRTATVPFRMSENEFDIVNLDVKWPIILLGRSGTGKTTCCVNRLWESYKLWKEDNVCGDKGQWLVWENKAIKGDNEQEGELKPSTSGDVQVEAEGEEERPINKLFARSLWEERERHANFAAEEQAVIDQEGKDNQFPDEDENTKRIHALKQAFITKNHKLTDRVHSYFRSLFALHPSWKDGEAKELEISTTSHIDEIPEQCYPLFVTSYEWLYLLDTTLPGSSFLEVADKALAVEESDNSDAESSDEEVDLEEEFESRPEYIKVHDTFREREVTFEDFVGKLWREMQRRMPLKDVPPTLVWTEIQSFIKGSYEALITDTGFLDRQSYESIGRKKAPNFSGNRDIVYDAFLMYERIKSNFGMFDITDIVFNLFQRFKQTSNHSWLLHEVYIDEAQDFTESELYLLVCCCRSVNGLFITGDTAQNIARGVSFRFCDLKSLFYHHSDIKMRDIYQLRCNYRSHHEIVTLASSVLHLLQEMFPESIDHIATEMGLFNGPKPLLLKAQDETQLSLLLLANTSDNDAKKLEFGADQVIIVATEASKDSLPDELRFSLCMTIEEAKGLEFNDVLLYNFFKDSQARDEWKVVNQFITMAVSSDVSSSDPGLAVVHLENAAKASKLFDGYEHKVLNSELKLLYTAITRARVNIWIFDDDQRCRSPMFNYFSTLGLVDVVDLSKDSDIPSVRSFAVSSTSEEWKKKGHYLYEHNSYAAAAVCFGRSGDDVLRSACLGHICREKADSKTEKTERNNLFLQAAKYFLEVSDLKTAVTCLLEGEKWELLASLYEKLEKYNAAVKYYMKAGATAKAIVCCRKAGNFKKAISIQEAKGKFIECLDIHEEYQKMPLSDSSKYAISIDVEDFIRNGLSFYLSHRDPTLVFNLLTRLPNFAAQENMLKGHKKVYREIMVDFYVHHDKREKAAEYLFDRSQYREAMKYCEDNKVFTAKCHLRYVEKAVGNMLSKQHVNTEAMLKKIKDEHLTPAMTLLESAPESDKGLLSECYLLQGLILSDWTNGNAAATLLAKQGRTYEALCCYLLDSSGKSGVFGTGCRLVDLLSSLYPLLRHCLKLPESHRRTDDAKIKSEVEHCLRYFGLGREFDHNGEFVTVCSENRLKILHWASLEEECAKHLSPSYHETVPGFKSFLGRALLEKMINAITKELYVLSPIVAAYMDDLHDGGISSTMMLHVWLQKLTLHSYLAEMSFCCRRVTQQSRDNLNMKINEQLLSYEESLRKFYQFCLKWQTLTKKDTLMMLPQLFSKQKNDLVVHLIRDHTAKWRRKNLEQKTADPNKFMEMAFYGYLSKTHNPPEYLQEDYAMCRLAKTLGINQIPPLGVSQQGVPLVDMFAFAIHHLNSKPLLHEATCYAIRRFAQSIVLNALYWTNGMVYSFLHLMQYMLVLVVAGLSMYQTDMLFILPDFYVNVFEFWTVLYTSLNPKIKHLLFLPARRKKQKRFHGDIACMVGLLCREMGGFVLLDWMFTEAAHTPAFLRHQSLILVAALIVNSKHLQLGFATEMQLQNFLQRIAGCAEAEIFNDILPSYVAGTLDNRELLTRLLVLNKQTSGVYSWQRKEKAFLRTNKLGDDLALEMFSMDVDTEEETVAENSDGEDDDDTTGEATERAELDDADEHGRKDAAQKIYRFLKWWMWRRDFVSEDQCQVCDVDFLSDSEMWKTHVVSRDHDRKVFARQVVVSRLFLAKKEIENRVESCKCTIAAHEQTNDLVVEIKSHLAEVNKLKADLSVEQPEKSAKLIEDIKVLLFVLEEKTLHLEVNADQVQEEVIDEQTHVSGEEQVQSEAEGEEFEVVSYKKKKKNKTKQRSKKGRR